MPGRPRFGDRLPNRSSAPLLACLILTLAFSGPFPATPEEPEREPRWWKGNLHTHSLWSDGDEFPEMVAAWYQENGYHFLAFTDHHGLLEGDRWVGLDNRHVQQALPGYLQRFGPDWVEARAEEGERMIRLKPLSELRHLFEEPGRFMLMMGQEITDHLVVHVNAIHLLRSIPPQRGDTVADTIQRNVDAVARQREETGQSMLAFVNHPNFQFAITAEEIAHTRHLRFFELYNTNVGVQNAGDDHHASTERIWDVALTLRHGNARRTEPLFGLATDDAHHFRTTSSLGARPGRGWVMVRARWLTPDSIIRALEAGDFYSSTGVRLREIRMENETLRIAIESEPGVTYRTEFIGTRRGYDPDSAPVLDPEGNPIHTTRRYSEDVGEVLERVEGLEPSYRLQGDEIYVRARIVSSKPMQDPTSDRTLGPETAWTQPIVPVAIGSGD